MGMSNYRVRKTGEIGKLSPCPSDDPIILEFGNGIKAVFHLRELSPTKLPITASSSRLIAFSRNGKKGWSCGIKPRTIEKLLEVYEFLQTQSEPVYRSTIEKAVGFNCARSLMPHLSSPVTLETLGVAQRSQGNRKWLLWELTEKGRAEGAAIIRGLKEES